MTTHPIPVITIDGPTASFHLLDSGALYRLTALQAIRRDTSLTDEHALAKLAEHMHISFTGEAVFLSNENVTDAIRQEEVGNTASKIAAFPGVRQALFALQLVFRKTPGLVADGRDMGTVIFPNAPMKVFLTASVAARAERRYKQLIAKGFSANMEDLLMDLKARDDRDTHRAIAPLVPAEGAHVLDTSFMTVDEAVTQVLQWYAAVGK
jgi:cytidylate kinase